MTADTTYNTKIQRRDSGDTIAVASGGTLDIESGGTLSIAGVDVTAEIAALDGILATAAEINRAADVSTRVVNLTAATLAITELAHDGKIVTVNKADGTAITLPVATGSGAKIKFFIGTTITSVGTTIKVADATDIMYGAVIASNDASDAANIWKAGGTDDTITLNGGSTGGYIGDQIELTDVATNTWMVSGVLKQTGTESTPFSATVA